MKAIKFSAIMIVLAAFAAVLQPVSASLWFPGQVTIWEDNDWEAIYRPVTNGGLERVEVSGPFFSIKELQEGDIFVGMWQVQGVGPAIDGNPGTTDGGAFSAVFVFEIDQITPNSADPTNSASNYGLITYKPTSATNWNFFGLDAAQTAGQGTMAALYQDLDESVDPAAGSSINDALATAADGTLLWEVGFAGETGEFWTAEVRPNNTQGGVSAVDFSAALNVTVAHAGPELAPHDWLFGPAGIESQIQLAGGASYQATGYFDVATDTDIFLKPVPEPTTAAVFFGLGVFAFGLNWLRRRRG